MGAGAIALTGGTAEADTIIASGILNTPIGFTSDSNPEPRTLASARLFNTFASGPSFGFAAFGNGNDVEFARGVVAYSLGHSTLFGTIEQAFRVPVGATWNSITGSGSIAILAARKWGTVTQTVGGPFVTGAYSLFRFSGNPVAEYGWLEFDLSVTNADSASHLDGPSLTLVQYAFDNTGAKIAAGELPTPEPASLAESGLAALLLGPEGLRRWRKAQQTA